MSSQHRILLQTNPCNIRTGLAENAKTLLKYLHKKGYTIGHYCTQGTATNAPFLGLSPWKSYGCIPPDQELINRINSDPIFGRDATYGSLQIDQVMRDFKPTIWIGSDDVWSFPLAGYAEKPWYSKVHSIHHITVDSLPVLDQAYEQAKRSKIYLTWAKFAALEMRRKGGDSMSHVSSIYGAMDTTDFAPIAEQDKLNLRRQFGISPDTVIFLFVFRNQLRKQANRVLEAFAKFKAEHPGVKAALHFHTSFSEKGQGWDLPKRAADYGIKREELLCTYVCKTCGAWVVAPYQGEDLRCPACGTDKSMITSNIIHGVPANQMKLIYGLADACVSIFTSGGQEYHSVQSLLCGKTLACTNYSCGEDFCVLDTEGFVHPVKWHPTDEAGTNFIKAANDVGSIAAFMRKTVRTPKRDLQEAGEHARDWAMRHFGIEAIGAQWEKLFGGLSTNLDWSTVDLTTAPLKNPTYQVPEGLNDDITWLKTLYKGILLMDVSDQDSGLNHWIEKLKAGVSRQAIHEYFVKVANDENLKSGGAKQQDFGTLLDDRPGRKRGLFVMKESIGDVAMVTSLFKSFHLEHPDTDLYVATDPKYAEVLALNEHIHKVLPYIPAMESELAMIGQGRGKKYFDTYRHPGIVTQRQLDYLSHQEPAFDVVLE